MPNEPIDDIKRGDQITADYLNKVRDQAVRSTSGGEGVFGTKGSVLVTPPRETPVWFPFVCTDPIPAYGVIVPDEGVGYQKLDQRYALLCKQCDTDSPPSVFVNFSREATKSGICSSAYATPVQALCSASPSPGDFLKAVSGSCELDTADEETADFYALSEKDEDTGTVWVIRVGKKPPKLFRTFFLITDLLIGSTATARETNTLDDPAEEFEVEDMCSEYYGSKFQACGWAWKGQKKITTVITDGAEWKWVFPGEWELQTTPGENCDPPSEPEGSGTYYDEIQYTDLTCYSLQDVWWIGRLTCTTTLCQECADMEEEA